jgi:hypothetical protein
MSLMVISRYGNRLEFKDVCVHDNPSNAYCADCAQSAREMRACADCEQFAPLPKMIRKNDGRVLCQDCQKRIDRRAKDRAQADLFTEQLSLI